MLNLAKNGTLSKYDFSKVWLLSNWGINLQQFLISC